MIPNLKKIYLDEKVWIIENFLTQEEIRWFNEKINDPKDWYITRRSPYKNILNKFLGYKVSYNSGGEVMFPDEDTAIVDVPIFSGPNGLWNRLRAVLPEQYKPHSTLQTFKYMTDEEISKNTSLDINDIDFAMPFHGDGTSYNNMLFSFSLYLNDDFEGGELEFKYKPIKIKPKTGMLVGIPSGEEYTHKVNKVLGPNSRHTFYGNSWNNAIMSISSNSSDC